MPQQVSVVEGGRIVTKAVSPLSAVDAAKVKQLTYICEGCGATVYPFYLADNTLVRTYIVSRMCPCHQKHITKREEDFKIQRQREQLARVVADSMVSERFKNSSFEKWVHTSETEDMYLEVTNIMCEYDKRKASGDGLIICGPSGIGKTHLLAAAGNKLLSQGKRVVFANVPELLKKIRGTYNKNASTTENDLIKKLIRSDMLILDDLGAEKSTEWTEEALYVLINGLYMRKSLVLCSTNHRMMDLSNHIGDRSFDRLIEMCRIMECDAPSYREEIARQKSQQELFKDNKKGVV